MKKIIIIFITIWSCNNNGLSLKVIRNNQKKDSIIELRNFFKEKRDIQRIKIKFSDSVFIINNHKIKNEKFQTYMFPYFEDVYLHKKEKVLAIKIYFDTQMNIEDVKLIIEEVKKLYLKIWNNESLNIYQKKYSSLNKIEQKKIKKILPYYFTYSESYFLR